MQGFFGKRTFSRGVGRFLGLSAPLLRRWARKGYFGARPGEQPPQKILLLACAWIGDTFWATQVAWPLKKRFGKQALWVATPQRCRDLWWGVVPDDQVIVLEHVISDRTREDFAWSGLWSDAARLREPAFDVVLDLTGNRFSALTAFLARPARAYGCGGDELGHLYSRALPDVAPGQHESLRPYHAAAELLGPPPAAPVQPQPLHLPPSAGSLRDLVRALGVPAGLSFAVLVPGAGWAGKRWPTERFAQLARQLEEIQVEVVVVGGPNERELCEQVAAATQRARVVATAPLHHLGVLLDRARLVVTGDSGPAHLAAAAGVPVLALFNSTNPAFCRPLGPRVRVLRSGCEHQPEGTQFHCHGVPNHPCPASCWDDLTVDRVLRACRNMLIS